MNKKVIIGICDTWKNPEINFLTRLNYKEIMNIEIENAEWHDVDEYLEDFYMKGR